VSSNQTMKKSKKDDVIDFNYRSSLPGMTVYPGACAHLTKVLRNKTYKKGYAIIPGYYVGQFVPVE